MAIKRQTFVLAIDVEGGEFDFAGGVDGTTLANYLEELAEITRYRGVGGVVRSKINGSVIGGAKVVALTEKQQANLMPEVFGK